MKINLSPREWTEILQLVEIVSDQIDAGDFGEMDRDLPTWKKKINDIADKIEAQAKEQFAAGMVPS